MKKWLKILIGIVVFLLLIFAVLQRIYLTPDYVSAPNLTGKLSESKTQHQQQERTYHWYAPNNITNPTILFVLHGSTGTGLGVREQTAYEFDLIADQEGFVVVYPTGYFNHWNDCRGSADYQANTENIDDISFLKTVEQEISQQLNLSFQNRFATGHSNGGHFCFKLALEAPEWIDGIAAISANLPIDANLDCQKSGQFVPLLLINGTEDPVNPYDGGLVSILGNDSRGTVLSSMSTMDYWIKMGNCDQSPTIKVLPDNQPDDNSSIEQIIWQCNSQPTAILYQINGGGHTIPHPKNIMPKVLGVTNQDIIAAKKIWQFFKQLETIQN